MDFVDKEDIAGIQIGQQRRQIAGFFNGWAGGDANIHPHLVGDDAGQSGLTQTRRAVQQGVIQGFSPPPGGLDVNRKIALGLLLTGVIAEQFRPQTDLPGIRRREGRRNNGRANIVRKFKTQNILLKQKL